MYIRGLYILIDEMSLRTFAHFLFFSLAIMYLLLLPNSNNHLIKLICKTLIYEGGWGWEKRLPPSSVSAEKVLLDDNPTCRAEHKHIDCYS